MFRDKRLDIGIGISIILHILMLILFSGSGKLTAFDYEDIKEITFIDQSYRPEVARVISKGSIWSDVKESYSDAEPSSYGGEIVTPAIDLDAKLDRTSTHNQNRQETASSKKLPRLAKKSKRLLNKN